MILLNEEHKLGRAAYLLMLVKSLVPPIIIFAIAIALALAANGIVDLIYVAMKAFGPVSASASALAAAIVRDAVLTAFAFAVVSLVMSFVTAQLNYRNYTFTFEEFGLRLKRGIFRVAELTIPYRQMQDVDIERGVLHQLTGTARVVVNSAGRQEAGSKFEPAEETNIVLDPIDKAMAEDIRLMLQRKIGVQIVEGEHEADKQAAEGS